MEQAARLPGLARKSRAITLAAALLALSGCTMIGHRPPPAGWPQLEERVVYGNMLDTHLACGGTVVSFAFFVLHACAQVEFNDLCTSGTCTIRLSSRDEYGELALQHERDHCAGKDHLNSEVLRNHFRQCRVRAGLTPDVQAANEPNSSTGSSR